MPLNLPSQPLHKYKHTPLKLQDTGLLTKLQRVKAVFQEPRQAGDAFDLAIRRYYEAVDGGQGGMFMAVCRGKVRVLCDVLCCAVCCFGGGVVVRRFALVRVYLGSRSFADHCQPAVAAAPAWYCHTTTSFHRSTPPTLTINAHHHQPTMHRCLRVLTLQMVVLAA